MFKKSPHIKPLAPLRSSDRRKLADQIIRDHQLESSIAPTAEETPEQKTEATASKSALRNSIFPDNTQSARFTTTHGPDLKEVHGTVYVGSFEKEEARILWFDLEKQLYPSVYTLWRNPDIVPLLHTPEIVVSKLKGGADLMTPGLAGGPPFPEGARKGAIVGIASAERPSVPVVVGWCEIDVAGLGKVQGSRGHAVRNMHWAGDEAWEFGATGKAGKPAPEVVDGWVKVLEDRGLTEKMEVLGLDDNDEDGGVAVDTSKNEPSNGQTEPANKSNELLDEVDVTEMSQREVDNAFRNAFLYGIVNHKISNPSAKNFGMEFPLTQSFVTSNLINPFLPAFTAAQANQLQMKKTSWKNVKKFIKTMDSDKIVKSREKDRHETIIIDIDFDDQAIVDFKPYRLPKKETMAGTAHGRGDKATDPIDTGDDAVGQTLKVTTYYKATPKLEPLFASAAKPLLATSEVKDHVNAYIEANSLVQQNNKRLVRLDPTLANAVFDGTSKLDAEVQAKGSVPRDALTDRVLRAMTSSYAIMRNNADPASLKTKAGNPPKIHITLETRSGNKTATKVSGLEPYFVTPKLLADELRKVCAGSTSVEPLAGAAKKNEKVVEEVMVQGPQKDAVVKALERRGVRKEWVEVLDKTKGKKK